MIQAQQQTVEKVLSDIGLGNVYYYAAQKLKYELAYIFSSQLLDGNTAQQYHEVIEKIELLFESLPHVNYVITDPFIHVDNCILSSQDDDDKVFTPTAESIRFLEKTMSELSLGTVHEFAKTKAIYFLNSIITQMKNNIARYRKKYGFKKSDELKEQIDNFSGFNEFEKEDDLMYWEDDETFLQAYYESLIELQDEENSN